jgi:hypothetical protein
LSNFQNRAGWFSREIALIPRTARALEGFHHLDTGNGYFNMVTTGMGQALQIPHTGQFMIFEQRAKHHGTVQQSLIESWPTKILSLSYFRLYGGSDHPAITEY